VVLDFPEHLLGLLDQQHLVDLLDLEVLSDQLDPVDLLVLV
jgi:hypothetical protein